MFVNHGTLHRIEHLPLAVQGLSGVERVSWKPLRGTPEKQPAAVGRDLRRMGPPIAGAGDADGLNGRVGAEAKKEIIMDAADGEGASSTGAAISPLASGRQVCPRKKGWRSREQTAYQRS